MTEPEEVNDPLAVRRESTASRERVWDVMADGWTYSQWVVGNSRMRAVDPHWPNVGASIRHSVGVWPAVLDDLTVVEECRPRELLVLLAKGRPFGKARITLRLSDIRDGCLIEMAEVPVGAPLGWVPNRLTLAGAIPRNRECTWRLAALAERKSPEDVD